MDVVQPGAVEIHEPYDAGGQNRIPREEVSGNRIRQDAEDTV